MDLWVNFSEYVKNNINSYQTSSQRKENNSSSNEPRIILILSPVKWVLRHWKDTVWKVRYCGGLFDNGPQSLFAVWTIILECWVLSRQNYLKMIRRCGFGGSYAIEGGLWKPLTVSTFLKKISESKIHHKKFEKGVL